jgi:hypothetical protein
MMLKPDWDVLPLQGSCRHKDKGSSREETGEARGGAVEVEVGTGAVTGLVGAGAAEEAQGAERGKVDGTGRGVPEGVRGLALTGPRMRPWPTPRPWPRPKAMRWVPCGLTLWCLGCAFMVDDASQMDVDTPHIEDQGESGGSHLAHMTTTPFTDLQLTRESQRALSEVLRFTYMTAVQEATLPVIMEGRDVMAKAKTGTGMNGMSPSGWATDRSRWRFVVVCGRQDGGFPSARGGGAAPGPPASRGHGQRAGPEPHEGARVTDRQRGQGDSIHAPWMDC